VYYRNGDVYVGGLKDTVVQETILEGQGTMTYKSGKVATGEWKYNFFVIGTIKMPNGDTAVGKSVVTSTFDGTITYNNGDVFEGSFCNDRNEGLLKQKGVFTTKADGKVVKGVWKNNVLQKECLIM
jgi:hypothetical protein